MEIPLHLRHFVGRRSSVVQAHHPLPQRSLPREHRVIRSDSAFLDGAEVFVESQPRDPRAVDAKPPLLECKAVIVQREPQAERAVADYLRGDALRQHALLFGIEDGGDVAVSVDVHKSRRHSPVGSVDHPPGFRFAQGSNTLDPVLADSDIGLDRRLARTIEYSSAPYDYVKLFQCSLQRSGIFVQTYQANTRRIRGPIL